MSIHEHLTEFAGRTVVEWESGKPLGDPRKTAYRLAISWDQSDGGSRWTDLFEEFLNDPASAKTEALVIGDWGQTGSGTNSAAAVEALVGARERLAGLQALFLGDIIGEESEISWITQSDVGPLFLAYPRLTEFVVRGGSELGFGRINHSSLQSLTIQSGGLSGEVVRQVLSAELPKLKHLELWLGTDNYGGDSTVEDVQPLLTGSKFPALKYLGLRDSDISDGLAVALAQSPILDRIDVLDLSLGTLGDEGAQALLNSPRLGRLKKLDIHYHFVSADIVQKLKTATIELDAGDPQEADEYKGELHRYVSVSE